jgi:hypothetical protein
MGTSGNRRLRQWLAAAALVGCVCTASLAQSKQPDPLSSGQVDQIRELGDRPVDRIKLLLQFIDDRLAAVKEMTPDSIENNRPEQMRQSLQAFTALTDELADNIETYDGDHADIRKALRLVVADSAKWAAVLKTPAPDSAYDFERTTALDATQASIEQAQTLLLSEEKYFAAHKKEAGGNGRAPTPE